MKIKTLAARHKTVIHSDNLSSVKESDLVLEDIWVKKYPYDILKHVCSDCFASPDVDLIP